MAAGKKRKKSHKKHCSSKREVFQMVQGQIEAKHPEKKTNTMGQQLRTINQLRPVIAAAKQKMREAGGQQA